MKILLFGRLGASLGRELDLEMDASSVAAVRAELMRRYPHAATDLAADRARACVNDALADEDRAVEATDEVAFLPPLSGG